MRRFGLLVFSSSLLLVLAAGCGKKGPPLAPLNLAPEPPQTVTARRLGDTIYLQLTVPSKNAAGRGSFSVDHIDVYAATLAPGTLLPPNRDLLKPEYVVAKIPVQPPLDPDAPEPEKPDTRPRPGEAVTFVETLTPALLEPQVVSKPPPPPKKPPKTTAAAPPAAPVAGAPPAAAPPSASVLTRLYVLRGVTKKGGTGSPSARLEVPLLAAPGAPRPGSPTSDESSVTVAWTPPPSRSDEVPGVLYNVYAAPAGGADATDVPGERPEAPKPLNPQPIAEQTFVHPGAEAGKQQCFVVRSVASIGTATIESDPSDPICVTPKDTFPPAAPKSLAAVGEAGAINLIWDANHEPDLGGYLVLRGEAPGATLQPLTRDPIKETRYADRAVQPGVRYVYQVIAVDRAGNRSAASNRVEEAAR